MIFFLHYTNLVETLNLVQLFYDNSTMSATSNHAMMTRPVNIK